MNKKDLGLVSVIGAAVGLLIQPMFTTLAGSLAQIGLTVDPMTRVIGFVFFLVLAPVALFIASLLGKVWGVLYQFAKFAAVGSLNSFIYFGIINLLIAMTGIAKGLPYAAFVLLGFLLSTTNSFFWNRSWTFKAGQDTSAGQAVAFYVIAALRAFINVGAASFVVNAVGHPGISDNLWANIGGLIGIAASLLWNFLGYKYFVFKPKTV